MKNGTILLWLLLALTACGPTDEGGDRQSLMEADQNWSETVKDADAFLAYVASDVYSLPPDGRRIQGPDAFRSSIDQILQMPGARLTWGPDVADVSRSGDLGYTIGSFDLTVDGPDGKPFTREGKYVTLWEGQQDGGWKVVADTFNFDAPMSATHGEGTARSEQ